MMTIDGRHVDRHRSSSVKISLMIKLGTRLTLQTMSYQQPPPNDKGYYAPDQHYGGQPYGAPPQQPYGAPPGQYGQPYPPQPYPQQPYPQQPQPVIVEQHGGGGGGGGGLAANMATAAAGGAAAGCCGAMCGSIMSALCGCICD